MPDNWNEVELAKLCSEKVRAAEDELYRKYAGKLYGLSLRYLDQEDAKDMVHDVLIKAIENINRFNYRGEGSLYAWISKIAINKILDKIKKKKYEFLFIDSVPECEVEEPDTNLLLDISATKLLEFISKLPEGRRTVFNLYCIEHYSHDDISKMLNISSKGSAAVLAKARNQLKSMINNYLKRYY